MATVAALLESGMIALVLAAAIGALGFGLFCVTDALERSLDRSGPKVTPRLAPPALVVVPEPIEVGEPMLESA